ncbi:MAG TPA: DUF4157 domain-containing protein [Candidatus Cybelea sp.]|nr:DUF4157 domain-containing protein [Candidatus Cybelea sp.]
MLPLAIHKTAPVAPQMQLRVSSPGDSAEMEAQAVGTQIARMAEPAGALPIHHTEAGGTVFRRAVANANVEPGTLADLQREASSGTPLPPQVRLFMEPRFGADFSAVRVHVGDRAASLCGQVGALAFTVGRDIYFAKDQFRPETPAGRELLAHELTHTIQQHGAAPRQAGAPGADSPPARAATAPPRVAAPPTPVAPPPARAVPAPATRVAARAPLSVQRLGISDAWNYFADKANVIPGFRMLTIVLGVNPLNMAPVDRSAANVLKAIVEFMPGGGIIVQALQNTGIFDKAGAWVSAQLDTLKMTGSAFKDAVTTFLGTLSLSDILDLPGVWERAKRIFTDPIARLIAFVKDLVVGILKLVKDAILLPLAKLAEGTRGWDLLIAVLGKNPITGEVVPQTAETLIGGFLKLIGQDEIWDNMKKSNAISRAWTWFKSAMAALLAFVSQIPDLFITAFKSLTIEDVVLVVGAFQKVASVFGGFLSKFIDWAGTAIWNLLEIIFDVVSPGALTYIKKAGAALKSILKDPLPFVGNLIKAAKLGFENFAAHFGQHLKEGLIDWLTGSLPGVYIPKAISLIEIGKFALSVLGVTWAQIRAKIVKALGPNGDKIMTALETAFDIVAALVKGGPAAAWDLIKEKLSDLKDQVISGLTSFVMDTIVSKAVPKLISLFVPGAGFISAILSIYDTVMVFVQKIAKIVAAVKAFVDSIVAIAAGQIQGAADKVESTLAGLLSLAISFLAGFLGLGNIASKIMGVITKVRDMVDKALDTAITWIVGKAKALFAKLFGGKDAKADVTTKLNVNIPFQMHGSGHQLTTVIGPNGLQIQMASRADYLRVLITGAETALKKRATPTQNDKDLLARLQKVDAELQDLEGQRFASFDQGGPQGDAVRAGITNQMNEIALLLSAIGDAFGIPDLTQLSHPSRYVGHLVGPNQYALLDQYTTAKRGRFYGGYRVNVDYWVSNQQQQSGRPGYWQDKIDNVFYPTTVKPTIDHIDPIAKHWNKLGGNDSTQTSRADWYNDTANFQLATMENNRSEGAKGESDMQNIVGMHFTGPSE